MTEIKRDDTLHKKRFGQFFSGQKVADMLFSLLPEDKVWANVVDPMAGIGDMLVSVSEHISYNPHMLGIEIDELVARDCADRVPEAKIICSDAFKSSELIIPEGWDLVITNPPYVRYQLQDENEVMPSARDIRENLVQQIRAIPYLTASEKTLFLSLAWNYSGLADMAVPAWILCAALVKKGGYLAIVVPETWLNRNYASPIQYLIQKCFEIEVIAKDANASWFPEVLVKTSLVVARRTAIKKVADTASSLTRIIEADREYTQPSLSLFPYIKGTKDAQKWSCKEDEDFFSKELQLPHELETILTGKLEEYFSLAEIGIECGQGFRSGANDFFYVSIKKREGDTFLVQSKAWDQGGKEYRFKKDDILLALQNRGKVEGLVVTPDKLMDGVVYPQSEISGDLQRYIDSAEKYRDLKGLRFKDYSAVKPNEKKIGDNIVREWFRLPKMASRHLPNLCLTRVSAKIPECLYVEQSTTQPIAIDANMVTLWSADGRTIRIATAMLNSTWTKISLELICTVMGGGALKVEASHLKKLLFPKFSEVQFDALERAGIELVKKGEMTDELQKQIDSIIACAVGNESITEQLCSLLHQKYKERSTRS